MNQSALVLAAHPPENVKNIQSIEHQHLDVEKLFKLSKANKSVITYFVQTNDPRDCFNLIKKKFKVIKAAGGLVKNGMGDYLFIYRLGKWDLPKGKVDPGESMKKAAVREIAEECGVKIDYLGQKLVTSYHTYQLKGELVLKKTNWYEMGVNKVPKLKPQFEEDITEAAWLPQTKFEKVRKNTYPSIAEVLDTVVGISH